MENEKAHKGTLIFVLSVCTILLVLALYFIGHENKVVISIVNSTGVVGFIISLFTLTTVQDVKEDVKRNIKKEFETMSKQAILLSFVEEHKKFLSELEKTRTVTNNEDNVLSVVVNLKEISKNIKSSNQQLKASIDSLIKTPNSKNRISDFEITLNTLVFMVEKELKRIDEEKILNSVNK